MKSLANMTIGMRFTLAAALPLVLVAVLLTAYLVQTRHQDSQKQFEQTGNISTQFLGSSAELALYAGNREQLAALAGNLNFSNLSGVSFLNQDRMPLATSDGFMVPDKLLQMRFLTKHQGEQLLYLQKPVFLTELDVSDYPAGDQLEDDSAERQVIGWVIAGFDTTDIQRQQQAIVMTGIGLGIAGLAIAGLLALFLGRTIVNPVLQLTDTVKAMEAGDLEARAQQASTIELSRLAQGINLLAKSVAEGRSNLEGKVRQATARLEQALADLREKNRELQQARETAEAANQAKSDFLARMSHELRTPITAIQGFTRLLHNAELGDAERNYCTIINQSSSQLLNLIDDILAFSRLQANAITLEAEPFHLIETLEQSVRQQALSARDKKLELILDIAPEVPGMVVGDHFRVSQIIINLITNAVKFTNSGYVRAAVTATPRDDDYSDLSIIISDTGIGIPQGRRNNLFDAFSQGDTSITRRYGGTGLGLSIVQSLLGLMGGNIRLDSSEGMGTVFHIALTLPTTAVEQGPPNLEARIGLLDRHNLSRQAVTHSLCRFTAEMVSVDTLDSLSGMALDALVVTLPSGVDCKINYQYLDQIRQINDAPLLILSAEPESCRRDYCQLHQHQRPMKVLDKPATQQSLHRALKQLLERRPDEQEFSVVGQKLLEGLNILIAEDNRFTREFLKTLLSREGAYCVTARNGVEAVTASEQEKFDIMLLDIHMPEKSGIETVRAIRTGTTANQATPIITITADVLQQEKLALKEAGITELLFKPVDEEQLLRRILHCCRREWDPNMPLPHSKLGDEIPVDQFIEEVKRLVSEAATACQQESMEAARDPVHQLKGIAGIFKLPELEMKVASLHKAIKNQRHSQVITALQDLQLECKRLESNQQTTG
ncbi:MAG: ATP-binding protein [Porticoccaceae bacterium]|nr:ATP-binding protein [Porticoccaceae bacterium]